MQAPSLCNALYVTAYSCKGKRITILHAKSEGLFVSVATLLQTHWICLVDEYGLLGSFVETRWLVWILSHLQISRFI